MIRKTMGFMTFAMVFSMLYFVCASSVHAFGLGVYVPFSSGNSEFDYEDGPNVNSDISTSGAIGFVMDTNLSGDRVFNYRLNLGLESGKYKKDHEHLNFDRYVFDNTFGFRLLRNDVLRVWLGPQIRLAYTDGDNSLKTAGIGIAPVLGVNINPGSVFTVGIDTGYRYSWYLGNQETPYSSDKTDVNTTEGEFFVNFSIIFRLNEK